MIKTFKYCMPIDIKPNFNFKTAVKTFYLQKKLKFNFTRILANSLC